MPPTILNKPVTMSSVSLHTMMNVTIRFRFYLLKVKQNPRDRQGSSLLSPAPDAHPRQAPFSLRCRIAML